MGGNRAPGLTRTLRLRIYPELAATGLRPKVIRAAAATGAVVKPQGSAGWPRPRVGPVRLDLTRPLQKRLAWLSVGHRFMGHQVAVAVDVPGLLAMLGRERLDRHDPDVRVPLPQDALEAGCHPVRPTVGSDEIQCIRGPRLQDGINRWDAADFGPTMGLER